MKQFHILLPGLILAITLTGICGQAAAQPSPDCANTAATHTFWNEVYASREDERLVADALARELLPCLASPDSELRDDIGYGLYTYWLRNDRLSLETRNFLLNTLTDNLQTEDPLLRSFSALILSELMRADAITPFMSEQARETLLRQTLTALQQESDYRGLDPQLGWVHPVAHMADVLWRFALHPALSATEARAILAGVRIKASTSDNSYTFNEGDRLARVAAIIIRTEMLPDSELVDWLQHMQTRINGEDWSTAFASVAGMTELHNVKGFVRALSDQLNAADIAPTVATALQELTNTMAGLV